MTVCMLKHSHKNYVTFGGNITAVKDGIYIITEIITSEKSTIAQMLAES